MKNFLLKLKDIPKSTVGRIIALVLACANQVVAVIGASSFASASWYQIVSIVVTIAVAAWTAYENNDFSFFAKMTTQVLDDMEDGKISADEVQALLDTAKTHVSTNFKIVDTDTKSEDK